MQRALPKLLGRSPETVTPDDLRRLKVHLAQQRRQPSAFNGAVSALPLFCTTRDRLELARHLARVHLPETVTACALAEEVGL